MRKLARSSVLVFVVVVSYSLCAQDTGAIQKKLESQYTLTRVTADNNTIQSAGAVLVLQKGKLTMVSAASQTSYASNYKDGKITLSGGTKAGRFLRKCVFGACPPGSNQEPPTKDFNTGDKMWVTRIEVKSDAAVFYLLTDPFDDIRFKASLTFPFPKGSTASPDDIVKLASEVFTVDSGGDQGADPGQQAPAGGGQQASSQGPSQPEGPAVVPPPPPPPPPDAPAVAPKTTTPGQTTDEVVANLGKPDNIVNKDPKGKTQIYFYKALGLKVTFVDGKVTNIE